MAAITEAQSVTFPALPNYRQYRIWDCFSLPAATGPNGSLEPAIESLIQRADQFGIERLSPYFHIGLGTLTGGKESRGAQDPARIRRCLERWPDRLVGFVYLNPTDPAACLAAMEHWIEDGPMAGIVFQDAPPAGLVSSHPNHDRIVRRAHELGAVIMHYTWYYTGGKRNASESTPADLAELAARHREITFVCSHAGGEWEKGIRAVYRYPNIVVETSGFDPTSGFVDMAVRELGAQRVIYGGHLPSRCIGTEFAKVLGARLTEEERFLIFGKNFRRLLKPLFTKRGQSLEAPTGNPR